MILTTNQAVAFADDARARGQRVVLATGVFDLLHPGHVRYLTAAKADGDVLIVALDSDRSARAAKGPGRPVMPEQERAEIVAALGVVDAVLIALDHSPAALIDLLKPDVLAKDAATGHEWSTSAIMKKAQAVPAPAPRQGR